MVASALFPVELLLLWPNIIIKFEIFFIEDDFRFSEVECRFADDEMISFQALNCQRVVMILCVYAVYAVG